MAVNIDKVYQTVQRILNKEQRGYLPPVEFNLFANQAQTEVFEQYFFDQDKYMAGGRNDSDYADITQNIGEKLSVFELSVYLTGDAPLDENNVSNRNVFLLPGDLYRVGVVGVYPEGPGVGQPVVRADEVSTKESLYINQSPLTAPTIKQPVYTRGRYGLEVFPADAQEIVLTYLREPLEVKWGYMNVSGKAVYNANDSTHFEVHYSDYPDLVYKICALAGVAIRALDVTQIIQGEEAAMIQQEKQ